VSLLFGDPSNVMPDVLTQAQILIWTLNRLHVAISCLPKCTAKCVANRLVNRRWLKDGLGFLKLYNDLCDLLGEKAGAARERRYLPLFAMITMTYKDAQVICAARCAGFCVAKM